MMVKDKPSVTNRPNKPVTSKTLDIGVQVDVDTDKLQRKLRAIAKYAEALADELDAIDNAWECSNCGASNYFDMFSNDKLEYRKCEECNHAFTGEGIELPTRLEGSE